MDTTKVWLITGASRGLGFEIVKAALANGDKVVAAVRREPQSVEKRLNHHENLLVTLLDVNDKSSVESSVKNTLSQFGRIDVLVNNAGYGLLGAVEEASEEEIRNNYQTNVFGLLNVTRAVLPQMRSQRSGHIINFSSVGGIAGFTGWGIYCSTKFAVEGITESLAAELAPLGIFVTAVEPGFFRTEFLDNASLMTCKSVIADYANTAGAMRATMAVVNKNQPGSPEKLARAMITLANSPRPPVHLILGKDALAQYRHKAATREKEIEHWSQVIENTDHD
jgi:NAD(P)-dependent dehydrogenase (short-subunit alcohol dehydrogenase family)